MLQKAYRRPRCLTQWIPNDEASTPKMSQISGRRHCSPLRVAIVVAVSKAQARDTCSLRACCCSCGDVLYERTNNEQTNNMLFFFGSFIVCRRIEPGLAVSRNLAAFSGLDAQGFSAKIRSVIYSSQRARHAAPYTRPASAAPQ